MAHFLTPLLRDTGSLVELRNCRTGRILATTIEPAFDSASRRRGLLGRSGMATGSAIIIAPCSAVHTCFMRFPIDVVFASRDGRVLKTRPGVSPWRVAGAWRAFAAIELPTGTIDATGTRSGDRVEIVPHS
jgi:uncharacterized membrane protein (UPF0127 family)